MRYSLSAHGSGSKLSSLSEQVEEQETQRRGRRGGGRGEERQQQGSQRGKKTPADKGETPLLVEKPVRRVYLDQLITTSQVLMSDDEEEIEEDEVDFPISLSLQSSQSSNKTEEQEEEEEEVEEVDEDGCGSEVATPKFPARSGAGRRCKSAGGGGGRSGSFSRQHSEQLTENFQQISSRAASLSSHQSWLESSGDSALFAPAAITEYHFEVSPASEIKPVTPTFHLPPTPRGPPSLSQSNCPPESDSRERRESCENQTEGNLNVDSSYQRDDGGREGRRRRGVTGEKGERERAVMAPLKQAVALAGELAAMAQARQGPIMLLSTDLVSSFSLSLAL